MSPMGVYSITHITNSNFTRIIRSELDCLHKYVRINRLRTDLFQRN